MTKHILPYTIIFYALIASLLDCELFKDSVRLVCKFSVVGNNIEPRQLNISQNCRILELEKNLEI